MVMVGGPGQKARRQRRDSGAGEDHNADTLRMNTVVVEQRWSPN